MSNDFWFPWYPAIFKKSTLHLSAEQDGIYRRLVDHYMETREPLPDNDLALARIAGVNENKWLDAKGIVTAFFTHKNGMFHHAFCDKQLDIQDKKTKRRSASAEKAANKRWGKTKENQTVKCVSHADGMRADATETETETVDTNVSTPLTPKGGTVIKTSFLMPEGATETFDGLFERFWKAYPNIRNKGHKSKAKEQFKNMLKKGESYERIGKGIAKYRRYCENEGQKNADMFRWIRDKSWENDYRLPEKPKSGRGLGYSLENAHNQAMDDKTRQPAGREDRLKNLGIY